MNIRIDWNENGHRGGMEYNADVMIEKTNISTYKKWAKLFAKYGTSEQHDNFFTLIKKYYTKEYEALNLHLASFDDNSVKRSRKRMETYNRKYEILLGLIQ